MGTVGHPAESRRLRNLNTRRVPVRAPACNSEPVTPTNPHHRGGKVLFEFRFRSEMTGADLELLRRLLDMTTHVEHKLPADPNSPAVARLDDYSGLFLEHVAGDDQWLLQARTWGAPSLQTVRGWRVRTAQVAHQLDPTAMVALPGLVPSNVRQTPQRPVGRAANRRLARLRRRLAGLR